MKKSKCVDEKVTNKREDTIKLYGRDATYTARI